MVFLLAGSSLKTLSRMKTPGVLRYVEERSLVFEGSFVSPDYPDTISIKMMGVRTITGI